MNKKFYPFMRARSFIRKIGLRNTKDWNKYSKSKRPNCIPSDPRNVYHGNGWNGMGDWIGNSNCHRGRKKGYCLTESFFSEINEIKAYILGFWWADGNIYISSHNAFRFSICQKEKYILSQIAKEMNCVPEPIRPYNGSYVFAISSKRIVEDIVNLGGTTNKSLTSTMPNINKKFMPYFIRGYFDGDGSIYIGKGKYYHSKFTCGSEKFINSLHNYIKECIPDIGGHMEKSFSHYSKNPIYVLCFGSSDTIKLYHLLYPATDQCPIFLKRKHELFLEAVQKNFINSIYTYNQLKDIIKNNNIKTPKELHKYRKLYDKRIPASPIQFYKEYDRKTLFNRFVSFEEAKAFVSEKNFNSVIEFNRWRLTEKRPPFIHSNPQKYYKNYGWTNWVDFLGFKTKKE